MNGRVRTPRDASPLAGPVGSVYLDAPVPARFRPTPRNPVRMARVAGAALLALVGMTAVSAASLAYGVRSLVGEPGAVTDAVDGAFDDYRVHREIEAEFVATIMSELVGAETSVAVADFGVDVEAEATRIAGTVVDDPMFRAALRELVAEVHQRVMVAPDATPLDLQPLTDAVVATIETESPALYAVLPENPQMTPITTDDLPDVAATMGPADRALLASIGGLLALALAAGLHPRRHRVVTWTGRWLLAAGLAAGILAVGIPWLGGHLTGWATVEVAARSISLRLLAPAGLAGLVGMGLVSVAAVAQTRERRRVSAEGAAAALGVDEPPIPAVPTSPALELARRGLVDTGERLTNV